MSSESKVKYIRTTMGPKTIEDIKKETYIADQSFPLTSLPCEHIIHNITEYLQENNSILDSKDRISLSNLSIIRNNPLIIYQNLYFEPDIKSISNELDLTKKYNCGLICDVTNQKYHQNKELLKKVQTVCKINICFGQSLDYSKAKSNLKKYSNDLQYLIIYGDENELESDKIIPGFIGEELIDQEFDMNKDEYKDKVDLYQMVINDLVNKYGIPFFIKLLGKQKYKSTNTIIDFFNKNKITDKKKLVFILSIGDYDENNFNGEIKNLIEFILINGYSIILTTYECDYSILNKNDEKQLKLFDLYYNKPKALFLNQILKDFSKYVKQIMLSNNINYRIQLKEYGGFGFNNLFENYYDSITKGLNKEDINDLMYNNLLHILCYWQYLEKIQKSVKKIKCENCQTEKDEGDKELFNKYDKIFCTHLNA
jgi:hypothetical protein